MKGELEGHGETDDAMKANQMPGHKGYFNSEMRGRCCSEMPCVM